MSAANVIIRRPTIEDVQACNAYTSALADEGTDTISSERHTVEQTLELLKSTASKERAIFLGAWDGQVIVGGLGLFAGEGTSFRHAGRLGMSVLREYRRNGIGRKLLETAIQQAKDWPGFCRIELDVVPWNAPAIRLYESMGFVHEGTKHQAANFRGAPHDLLMMALFW